MPKDEFERGLDRWAKHEVDSAPDLQPTPEMVHLVSSKRRTARLSNLFSRQSWAGIGVAVVFLLLAGYFLVSDLESLWNPAPVEQVAFLVQQPLDLPGDILGTPQVSPPDKGRGKGASTIEVLSFQVYRPEHGTIDSANLMKTSERGLVLHPQDHFRVLIQSGSSRFFNIYQINPTGVVASLHPDSGFVLLEAGTLTYIPEEPDWVILTGETGEYRLVVISSQHKLDELESLYLQTPEMTGAPGGAGPQAELLAYLDKLLVSPPEQIEVWDLRFEFQD
jgi:hypothetical protein